VRAATDCGESINMAVLENIWWLLVLIGVMILVHELGHFWAARFFDVRVEAFSFGFGPRLFGFRRGETDFRFSLILFGGYVKMAGEQPGEENATEDPRSFSAKPRWNRLIIAFAGPAMNMILAVVLLAGLFMVRYPQVANFNQPATIGFIEKGSPADKAGLREGDRIIRIDDKWNPQWKDVALKEVANAKRPITVAVERGGQTIVATVTPVLDEKLGVGSAGWDEQNEIEVGSVMEGMDAGKQGLLHGDVLLSVNGIPIRSISKLHDIIRESNGQPVSVTYLRDGKTHTAVVTPSQKPLDGQSRWMIGVALQRRVIITQLAFGPALAESVKQNVENASLIFQFLRGIVERRMSPKSLEGPIRIAQLSGEAAREGPTAFIGLMTMVSLNLAVFNLLPIPILDGGMILMLLIEMLLRRDLSMPVKEAVLKMGMVFLMIVVAFVLYNDISKMLPPG
jgi:regulator of sigma E protease